LPEVKQQDEIVAQASEGNPAVRAAAEQAAAKELKARGERKLRFPTIDLAGQYGLFSRYNNYDQYFNKFQRNNATFALTSSPAIQPCWKGARRCRAKLMLLGRARTPS